jgi:hypothetical protein
MKFIHDYIEFRNRTKPICDDFDLDLIPDVELGGFFPHRLDELKRYCADNPEYHIISILPSAVKVNKPVPSARIYLLADGDADPSLWYCDDSCKAVFRYSKIREFDRG